MEPTITIEIDVSIDVSEHFDRFAEIDTVSFEFDSKGQLIESYVHVSDQDGGDLYLDWNHWVLDTPEIYEAEATKQFKAQQGFIDIQYSIALAFTLMLGWIILSAFQIVKPPPINMHTSVLGLAVFIATIFTN